MHMTLNNFLNSWKDLEMKSVKGHLCLSLRQIWFGSRHCNRNTYSCKFHTWFKYFITQVSSSSREVQNIRFIWNWIFIFPSLLATHERNGNCDDVCTTENTSEHTFKHKQQQPFPTPKIRWTMETEVMTCQNA